MTSNSEHAARRVPQRWQHRELLGVWRALCAADAATALVAPTRSQQANTTSRLIFRWRATSLSRAWRRWREAAVALRADEAVQGCEGGGSSCEAQGGVMVAPRVLARWQHAPVLSAWHTWYAEAVAGRAEARERATRVRAGGWFSVGRPLSSQERDKWRQQSSKRRGSGSPGQRRDRAIHAPPFRQTCDGLLCILDGLDSRPGAGMRHPEEALRDAVPAPLHLPVFCQHLSGNEQACHVWGSMG